jgi:hypothetical protein
LLAGTEPATTAEAIVDEVVHRLPSPSGDTGKHALAEAIRLEAIERAGAAGTQRLARARVRLSGMARRIAKHPADAADARPFQRLLEGSASLAASAAAAAAHPVVADDGGVDRRFRAALRQLSG